MTAASVTIVVRTMGRPQLARAIASLRAQTHPALEVVLVIANPAFVPDASLVAPPVRALAFGVPLSRPLAANRGLAAAATDYVGLLDEDDWLEPVHVASLVAALAANPGYALAYSDTVIAGQPPAVMSRGYWKLRFQDYPVFTINAALFSRQLLAAGCRFDAGLDLVEDWDFWLQCAQITDFLHVPVATACYDPASGTSGTGRDANRDDSRSGPAKALLREKWEQRYRAIEAAGAKALEHAGALIEAGEIDGARDRLLAALHVDPGNPMLLNRLARCMLRRGESRIALAALRRACDVDRRSLELRLQLALLEHACGERDAATRSLDAARALATDAAGAARLASAAATIAGTR
jgi:tetratricopeptide (TPR) repeat protein